MAEILAPLVLLVLYRIRKKLKAVCTNRACKYVIMILLEEKTTLLFASNASCIYHPSIALQQHMVATSGLNVKKHPVKYRMRQSEDKHVEA